MPESYALVPWLQDAKSVEPDLGKGYTMHVSREKLPELPTFSTTQAFPMGMLDAPVMAFIGPQLACI
ncbi:hypothetical protein GCM10028822_25910 [Hymenobacter terrigena]